MTTKLKEHINFQILCQTNTLRLTEEESSIVLKSEEEYQTWYVYFLEYYIDDESIFKGTKEYKEAKKLLDRMIKFFGIPNFNQDHRAGSKLRFVRTLVKTGIAQRLMTGNDTEHQFLVILGSSKGSSSINLLNGLS